MNSTNSVDIVHGRSNKADSNGNFIRWNPDNTVGGYNKMGYQDRPAFIGLGHEMAHIQDIWNGTYDSSEWISGDRPILNAEKYATHVENQLRAENGISLREYYAVDRSNRPLKSTSLLNNDGSNRFNSTVFYYHTVRVGTHSSRIIWNR